MVKGAKPNSVSASVAKKATARLAKDNLPFVWFGRDGQGRPRVKTYLEAIKKGKVPVTYWAEEEAGYPVELDATSWGYKESGRTSDGVSELTAIVGQGHNFTTVKPLKLFTKLLQIWCPADGLVLDPFAGSGTTGHAVLQLNADADASRRFILIEQGNAGKNDHYASTLTADRLRRVISGKWASGQQPQLAGGFRFNQLKNEKIDAVAVNALEREEMIDLLLNSYWDKAEKARSYLRHLPIGTHKYLFAVNPRNEGFFLVWENAKDSIGAKSRDV